MKGKVAKQLISHSHLQVGPEHMINTTFSEQCIEQSYISYSQCFPRQLLVRPSLGRLFYRDQLLNTIKQHALEMYYVQYSFIKTVASATLHRTDKLKTHKLYNFLNCLFACTWHVLRCSQFNFGPPRFGPRFGQFSEGHACPISSQNDSL